MGYGKGPLALEKNGRRIGADSSDEVDMSSFTTIIDALGRNEFVAVAAIVAVIAKLISNYLEAKQAREQVLQAEREAFRTLPEALANKTTELVASQEQLEQRTKQITDLLENAQATLRVGVLFDLYSKQIEKYQTETRARAGWSFIFAIFAMVAGLSFVIWGGTVVFSAGDWQKVAAGSAISAIGGAVSAFITKTFLDVHRLSLLQLNRYFRQPVLSSHVLTAQRLADQLDDPTAKSAAYGSIISHVVALIREDADSRVPLETILDSTSATARTGITKRIRKAVRNKSKEPTQ
jgi:hypothetical protein